ncbi:MAG: lipo-like protein [Bauldia sp.]
MADSLLDRVGRFLARYLRTQSIGYEPYTPSDPETLRATLQPADILLVEGNQRISAAIKYLTQSTWSHAALYIGDPLKPGHDDDKVLIECNVADGCIAVPLSAYRNFNTRICRPVGLTDADRKAVTQFMIGSIGRQYDVKNIVDLARYLLPTPPVPVRWRRRMIAFGSGDPTRAICSSLIAEAFGRIGYPILPLIETRDSAMTHPASTYSRGEILHIRHYSLYTPRDFDLSPFFRVVKPTIEHGFDYKLLKWSAGGDDSTPSPPSV